MISRHVFAMLIGCAWAIVPVVACGMTFEVEMLRGEPAIRATGEIVAGDANRLRAVLTPDAKHSLGYYALILESPGGSVDAAFELSRLIDSEYVNTYVAPDGHCVSACAAILFVSGREHVAVPGSFLGFHGCFDPDTNEIAQLCNEQIGDHAFAHGTAYGAVMSLIRTIPHDEIVWVSGRQADCLGINRYEISEQPSNYLECVRMILRELSK